MSRKSRFGGPFNKQHGKQAQTLLKSASHHLHHIDWSTPSELSWKKYLLLTYQILGLPVNTLAPDEKYPLLNRDNFTIPIQMELSQKQKNFSHFFPAFLKSRLNFKHLKKNITLIDFIFSKLATPKTWIDECLKSPVSEDASTSSMVNVPKHCWNRHHSTFIIFIGHCEKHCVRKMPSYWHAKSWDCFLTHSLPMKSILPLIETI